jgi:SAM-dependent methyltransferase
MARAKDGSAGDADYGAIGRAYAAFRQPEPSIAQAILEALGGACSVLNVGAGAGSYEPIDREVIAIESSAAMRAQRPDHLTRAIDGVAESLPFADRQFDAAMTTFSVHQWASLDAGLRELRRVTRGPVLVLSCDPEWSSVSGWTRMRQRCSQRRHVAIRGSTISARCSAVPTI